MNYRNGRMRIVRYLLGALICCGLAAGCSRSKSRHEFRLPDWGLSAVMPAEPQKDEPDPEAPNTTVYFLDHDDTRFVLSVVRMPATFDPKEIQRVLDGLLKRRVPAITAELGVQSTGQRSISNGDLPGREWDFVHPDGAVGRERMFIIQPHGLCYVGVTWPKGQSIALAAEEFLTSVKVVKD